MKNKKRVKLTKELLGSLYLNREMTCREISQFLGYEKDNRATIQHYLAKFNIPRRSYGVTRYSGRLQKLEPSEEQIQIVTGSLLGDAFGKENGKILFGHSVKQHDYLLWKYEMMKPFSGKIRHYINKNKIYQLGNCQEEFSFYTCVHKKFKELRDLLYIKGKKGIPEGYLQRLSPLGVAVWFMDDGNFNHGNIMNLSTHSFTEKENHLIAGFFEKQFGIEAIVAKQHHTVSKKIYYWLRFNVKSAQKLISLIQPYIIPSMLYKIGESGTPESIRSAQDENSVKMCSELHSDVQKYSEMNTRLSIH